MIGYKGFDKNFCCLGFQYEIGKTYHLDGKIKICENGFHFCDEPLAVFEYYSPSESRFALVEAVEPFDNDGHKFCTGQITILQELTLEQLLQRAKEKVTSNTGNCSAATNSGDFSAATNTGFRSAATNSGDFSVATNSGDYSAATNTGFRSAATNSGFRSAATSTGKKSIALALGKDSKAKGALGCWLVLAEWCGKELLDVKMVKVDGQAIKPDTFYSLKNGEVVEVEED